MDNYICIDGVKVLLNDSQISELRAALEKSREPVKASTFERQNLGDIYYFITRGGRVFADYENNMNIDRQSYEIANYCTDEELLKQRALEEIFARRLWRYSMEHDGDKIDWSNSQQDKFAIFYDVADGSFYITNNVGCQIISTTYFVDRETAMNAIKEVAEPFMKEYPGFKSYRTSFAQLEGRTIC